MNIQGQLFQQESVGNERKYAGLIVVNYSGDSHMLFFERNQFRDYLHITGLLFVSKKYEILGKSWSQTDFYGHERKENIQDALLKTESQTGIEETIAEEDTDATLGLSMKLI